VLKQNYSFERKALLLKREKVKWLLFPGTVWR